MKKTLLGTYKLEGMPIINNEAKLGNFLKEK